MQYSNFVCHTNNLECFLHCFQELESLQKALEPLQNLILRLDKVAAKAKDEQLTEVNICLTDARKTDEEMRARLFVLQVARKYDLATAHKMSRRKAGEYDDPDLAKVLEENEKREDKLKRDRERAKSQSPATKRSRFGPGNNMFQRSPSVGFQTQTSPLAAVYPGARPAGYGGFSRKSTFQTREPKGCHSCGQIGHFIKHCPNKK